MRARRGLVALLLVVGCGSPAAPGADGGPEDAGAHQDAGSDAGAPDAGEVDAGEVDAGEVDAGELDAGALDSGQVDSGLPDAGAGTDAGRADAGSDGGSRDGGYDAGPFAGSVLNTTDGGAIDSQLVADFDAGLGPRIRYELYDNMLGPNTGAATRTADVATFNAQNLHGKVWRVWASEGDLYNRLTQTYDLTPIRAYYTDVSAVADELLVCIIGEQIATWGLTPAQWEPILEGLILRIKTEFPRFRYLEAMNEPDFVNSVTSAAYYGYYQSFVRAANAVNATLGLSATQKILVGGPALSRFDTSWLQAFLDGYAADNGTDKRIDFISYHLYNYRTDPSVMGGQRATLDAMLSARGLNTQRPAFVTELGLYPGAQTEGTPAEDQLRQSAGVATFLYYLSGSSKVFPFHWSVRHSTNERKDQLVTRPTPWSDTFTPYGNSLRLWGLLKANRFDVQLGAIVSGQGTFAVATADATGVSVLGWNYAHLSTAADRASIWLQHLPAMVKGVPVRLRRYRIDSRTSNSYANLAAADLVPVFDGLGVLPAVPVLTTDFEANSLQLWRIEPLP